MASAAYAFNQQMSSSEAQIVRPQFKLIEGGLSHRAPETEHPEPVRTFVAPYVPEFEEEAYVATRPEHSGAVTFLVAVVVALAICVVSVISSNVISARIANAVASVPSAEYVVCSGDSLWSIAETHPIEGHSASDVVTWIMERNNLNGGLIMAGQTLEVPSSSL